MKAGINVARGGPGLTCGGPGPRPQVLSISTSGTPDPSPSGKWVRDRWFGEMESDPRGPVAQLLRA